MALDLREGDILVVSAVEYPIRSCAAWKWGAGRAGRRLMNQTASTKRSPAIVSGKRGTPTTNLASLRCSPLDPVAPDLAQRMGLNTPHELLQTTVDGGDVFYVLVVEELKR
ncbi:MAG: hypothetical protein KAX65_01810 [Caldilineaceae bacterium]|nr:hypothetical protein [Caldilineaceae bacterium]